jgi:hypothetical protein
MMALWKRGCVTLSPDRGDRLSLIGRRRSKDEICLLQGDPSRQLDGEIGMTVTHDSAGLGDALSWRTIMMSSSSPPYAGSRREFCRPRIKPWR